MGQIARWRIKSPHWQSGVCQNSGPHYCELLAGVASFGGATAHPKRLQSRVASHPRKLNAVGPSHERVHHRLVAVPKRTETWIAPVSRWAPCVWRADQLTRPRSSKSPVRLFVALPLDPLCIFDHHCPAPDYAVAPALRAVDSLGPSAFVPTSGASFRQPSTSSFGPSRAAAEPKSSVQQSASQIHMLISLC